MKFGPRGPQQTHHQTDHMLIQTMERFEWFWSIFGPLRVIDRFMDRCSEVPYIPLFPWGPKNYRCCVGCITARWHETSPPGSALILIAIWHSVHNYPSLYDMRNSWSTAPDSWSWDWSDPDPVWVCGWLVRSLAVAWHVLIGILDGLVGIRFLLWMSFFGIGVILGFQVGFRASLANFGYFCLISY